ncbi:hypothetical protein GCM10009743_07700 [Kribbella swartbergensis]
MNPIQWLGARWGDYRARRARNAHYGNCTACGHDWREHTHEEGCGECQYEIDHDDPAAPLTPCRAQAPGITL